MLDVRRMKVLREVAARGSFSAAAEALSFTQSAISQQVAALERETGTKLVERGPRGIRLTQAGEVVVKHADAVLSRLSCAEEELQALAGLRGGRLALSTFQSAGATLVPRAIAEFHRRYPDVELALTQAEPEEATDLLRAGDLDLAIVYDFEGVPGSGLEEGLDPVHLIDDRYDLLVARDHPLADKARVRMADLADERWINSTVGCGCRQAVVHACERAGFEPHVAFENDEILAVQALVANGMGVTLMPQLALTGVHPGVAVRPLGREAPIRHIYAARMRDAYRSPATQAMLQLLVDMAEEFRPQVTPTGDGAVVAA
jgi:DNA-binding transcriptional LysR family regulator